MESSLSQDVVFDILSSSRRRYVLYRLREAESPVKLTELAEQVAAWENDTDRAQITEKERKRVYVSLYQTHIPRLDEVGLVAYDKETGLVEPPEEAIQVDEYLQPGDGRFRWELLYLGVAIGSVVALALTAVGPFGVVPNAVVAGVIVAAFVFTAFAHAAFELNREEGVPSELHERQ